MSDAASSPSIAVLGAGAWGTALANLYARDGRTVTLVARDGAAAAHIAKAQANERYLPGIRLSPDLAVSGAFTASAASAGILLLVVPAQALRAALRGARDASLVPGVLAVVCSKGIERETGRFASDIVAEELPDARVAVLSGPSFADDVARGLPTAVTVAAGSEPLADEAARWLSAEGFRCYASADIRGVEAGGALKNVLALAAGIVSGRGLGASALAAIVTRGLNELRRLGQALGGRPETLMGLSGLGDLVLTCSGPQSRNFAYGAALGRGDDLSGLKLAEGVYSAGIAARLAREAGIEAPIVETVAAILDNRLTVDEAARALLARPLKRETD